ncbi:HlyD family efflux transporter periplasmic adaptor subunit [Larkinella sp. VNQ87]|uniref:HlyD family efflux transporter periplasmic adaptor subunit n=1 Tax=Larkinella sp. VNQ87 TaxID=3400921 RepID=UPI003C0B4474
MMDQSTITEVDPDLDDRSEEVRDFIRVMPHWMIRWGTLVIFLVLSFLLAGTYLIHYPDLVQAPLVLTTTNAPKSILAKNDGRLMNLFITDKQNVRQDQVLAFLESTTQPEEALSLANELDKLFLYTQQKRWEQVLAFRAVKYQHLGDLQGSFQRFVQSFMQLEAVLGNGSSLKRRKLLLADWQDLRHLYNNLLDQQQIQQQDYELARKELGVQKKLLDDKVIPPLEYRREESRVLAKLLPLKQLQTALTQNHTAQSAKQRELLELDRTIAEQGALFVQELNALRSAIESWKQRFVVVSPMAGILYFNSDLQEKQAITANQELFVIATSDAVKYTGLLNLPQNNLGKVKIGHWVLIKFAGYPFQEFGIVRGQIKQIADVPDRNGVFLAKVALPDGLQTQYHKTIRYRTGMVATAEVITEDTRLIEKLFFAFKRLMTR